MKKIKWVSLALCLALMAGLLTGCKKTTQIPFSDLSWDATEEDVLAAEGTPKETYDSVYGGNAYSFDKTFLNYEGTIKYMFADDGKLASIAWAYTNDADTVKRVYNIVEEREVKANGKSEYSNTNDTAYGNVWYLDDVDVVITRLDMESGSALQYAYINNNYSKK